MKDLARSKASLSKGTLFWGVAAAFFFLPLYIKLEVMHRVVKAKMDLPRMEAECDLYAEKAFQLRSELDRLTHPARLFELSQEPGYAYLHFPRSDEILILEY